MSYELRADYQKQWLFPPSIEDWISADHPARFIREVVDGLDVTELGFRQRKSEEGRPNYGSDLLLKVVLYGYMEKIRSCRGLERACMKDVGLIWLTGLQYPDKNTLWRFWRDNKAALKNVYRQVLKLAARANLIGMVLHAVDGTKLQSAAAKDKAVHRDALEQRLNELIDQNVEEAIRETERAEAEDEGEYRLPEALQDRRRLREEIQRHLEDMKREGRKHKIDRDAEARLMKIEGKAEYGYNAQVVVDEQSGLIVGEQVVTDVSDNSQLVPMLDEVRQNLGAVAEQTVADGGYWTGAQLVQAEDRGYPVLVASNQAEKAHELITSHGLNITPRKMNGPVQGVSD